MEAHRILAEASETCTSPRYQFNLGTALSDLGRWAEAERRFARVLDRPDDPFVTSLRGDIGRSVCDVRSHLATLQVAVNVPGAEVTINGRVAGRSPLAPLRIEPGIVTLHVSHPRFVPVTRYVSLAAERIEDCDPSHPFDPPPTVQFQSVELVAEPSASTPRSALVPWLLAGLGGALLAGGTVTGVLALQGRSDLDAACRANVCTETERPAYDRTRTLAMTADVLFGTGGALAVTGVVWLLVAGRTPAASASPRTSLHCAARACVLGFEGRF